MKAKLADPLNCVIAQPIALKPYRLTVLPSFTPYPNPKYRTQRSCPPCTRTA
jgi:hypothetical protein